MFESGGRRRQSSLDKYFTQKECVKKRRTEDEEGVQSSKKFEDAVKTPDWSSIKKNNLNISFAEIFPNDAAIRIFEKLESEIEYFSGALAQVLLSVMAKSPSQIQKWVIFCYRLKCLGGFTRSLANRVPMVTQVWCTPTAAPGSRPWPGHPPWASSETIWRPSPA